MDENNFYIILLGLDPLGGGYYLKNTGEDDVNSIFFELTRSYTDAMRFSSSEEASNFFKHNISHSASNSCSAYCYIVEVITKDSSKYNDAREDAINNEFNDKFIISDIIVENEDHFHLKKDKCFVVKNTENNMYFNPEARGCFCYSIQDASKFNYDDFKLFNFNFKYKIIEYLLKGQH